MHLRHWIQQGTTRVQNLEKMWAINKFTLIAKTKVRHVEDAVVKASYYTLK